VLDPRPDTETLVDWALEVIAPLPAPRVVDLGTGSGAIALALKHQCPAARVLAVDASTDALAVAQANAQKLALPVECVQADWLQGVEGRFDAIVSNPPYIAASDPHLAALTHEPLSALPAVAMGWTPYAPSWCNPLITCCPAAGCCWNTAMTRPMRCVHCSRPGALKRCKAAWTWPASHAARADSGRQ
jgi:methylase of polypeptide subunit release factors